MLRRPSPIYELPPGYQEAQYLALLEPGRVLRLNLLALIPLTITLGLMSGWRMLALAARGPLPGGPAWPWWLWLILILVVILPLHEWIHGLAIRWAGHKPRYGVMLSKGALYATADGALFPRDVFIVIALAPLVGITLLAMLLIWILPDGTAYYIALAAALNAGSAIGDVWMAAAVRRCPPDALVRDEADSIRIYRMI
ncbi:MAG: DUF3267 domain-containing protein [Chloroflexi bacterium]|nr:DUF3267 domain-containing protein [Chloroflexota bacterium]